jgi:hypothetical protein
MKNNNIGEDSGCCGKEQIVYGTIGISFVSEPQIQATINERLHATHEHTGSEKRCPRAALGGQAVWTRTAGCWISLDLGSVECRDGQD